MAILAIIAGRGTLPVDIAHAARDGGTDVVLFAIRGQADSDFSDFTHHQIDLGAISKTRALMVEMGCDRLVMAGKVERPSLGDLRPDGDALKLLGKALTRGDDGLLRIICAYFAEAGIETISPDNFIADRSLSGGVIVDDAKVAALIAPDIELGISVLASLGALDVGQAAIIQQGRVIAIEAAEGTDAMISRAGDLLDLAANCATLLKMPKSGQDLRLDRPVFGVTTVTTAQKAGIGAIAIGAESVLLADPLDDIVTACRAAKIALIGVETQPK